MDYKQLIQACEGAGHDMSEARAHVTKAAPTRKPDPVLVTLDISEVASVIDDAIAPLEARIADLESRLQAVEDSMAAKHHSKPVLRVAAGGRRVE